MRRTTASLFGTGIGTGTGTALGLGHADGVARFQVNSDRLFLLTQAQYEGCADDDEDLDPLVDGVVLECVRADASEDLRRRWEMRLSLVICGDLRL